MAEISPHIGTLREKPLHAALKRWCALPGDGVEQRVDGYVIDIVRNDLLIEIQTRGFASIKAKVAALLAAGHGLRIVHPIAVDKWIVKLDDKGRELSRRKSPRHGTAADVFSELVSFPNLIAHPGLEIELVLVEEEELRVHTPDRSWRRKGWSVRERRLVDVLAAQLLRQVSDLEELLPLDLPDPFTTADLAAGLRRPRRLAQQAAYCLRKAGAITATGKRGNAVEYRLGAG